MAKMPQSRDYYLNNKEWLEKQYWELGKSTKQISKELGYAGTYVAKRMKALGIPRRPKGFQLGNRYRVGNRYHVVRKIRYEIDETWLYHHYVELDMSIRQIAELIGCDRSTVFSRLKLYNMSGVGWYNKEFYPDQIEHFKKHEKCYIAKAKKLLREGTVTMDCDPDIQM